VPNYCYDRYGKGVTIVYHKDSGQWTFYKSTRSTSCIDTIPALNKAIRWMEIDRDKAWRGI